MRLCIGLGTRPILRFICVAVIATAIAACSRGRQPEVTAEDLAQVRPGGIARQSYCPSVVRRRQNQGYPVYQSGFERDPKFLIYQGTITRTARECTSTENELIMRVGVGGRVLRGPGGSESITASLPIRVAVVGLSSEPIFSQTQAVSVVLADGQTSTSFSVVQENVTVPLTPDLNPRDLQVVVGFDIPLDEDGLQ